MNLLFHKDYLLPCAGFKIESMKISKSKAILTLLGLSFIWGSSFVLMKKGLVSFQPLQVASLRIVIASIAFLPIFIKKYKLIESKDFKYIAIVGYIGSAIPFTLFSIAQTKVNSSMAGVLNGLTPIFALIVGVLFFKVKNNLFKTLGVVIGMIGASILILGANGRIEMDNVGYSLLIVVATICYAISVNTVGAKLHHVNSLSVSSASFIIIAPIALIYLFSTDFISVIQTHEGVVSLMYITILALLGTFLATIIFFRLVQDTDAIFSSTVAYLIPGVALFWGVIDGEVINLIQILGLVLIVSGVYLSRK